MFLSTFELSSSLNLPFCTNTCMLVRLIWYETHWKSCKAINSMFAVKSGRCIPFPPCKSSLQRTRALSQALFNYCKNKPRQNPHPNSPEEVKTGCKGDEGFNLLSATKSSNGTSWISAGAAESLQITWLWCKHANWKESKTWAEKFCWCWHNHSFHIVLLDLALSSTLKMRVKLRNWREGTVAFHVVEKERERGFISHSVQALEEVAPIKAEKELKNKKKIKKKLITAAMIYW